MQGCALEWVEALTVLWLRLQKNEKFVMKASRIDILKKEFDNDAHKIQVHNTHQLCRLYRVSKCQTSKSGEEDDMDASFDCHGWTLVWVTTCSE